jgi:hypothetical protein
MCGLPFSDSGYRQIECFCEGGSAQRSFIKLREFIDELRNYYLM